MRRLSSTEAVTTLEAVEAAVPEGLRVYAVGDIHGRADLLARMAEMIGEDLRRRPVGEALTICLGDYIDRGPDAATVIERLVRCDFPTRLVTLKGNHEQMMQAFLAGALAPEPFYRNGGDATIESYGLDAELLLDMSQAEVLEALADAMPKAHRRFVDSAGLSATVGDYFFCHAGVRPGVPLERQSADDLLWIREEFLLSTVDFGKVVIHGHTPVRDPLVRRNGIGIDTGAFATGVLTAIVLEGTRRHFIQARER